MEDVAIRTASITLRQQLPLPLYRFGSDLSGVLLGVLDGPESLFFEEIDHSLCGHSIGFVCLSGIDTDGFLRSSLPVRCGDIDDVVTSKRL